MPALLGHHGHVIRHVDLEAIRLALTYIINWHFEV